MVVQFAMCFPVSQSTKTQLRGFEVDLRYNWIKNPPLHSFLFHDFSLCSRRLEVVGARKNGHARGRHACARSFSHPLLPSAYYAG